MNYNISLMTANGSNLAAFKYIMGTSVRKWPSGRVLAQVIGRYGGASSG